MTQRAFLSVMKQLAFVIVGAVLLASAPAQAQAVASQNFVKQLHWARAGDLEAQMFVAKAFVEGRIVERDMQQAVGWYLRAAKRGNVEAQFQAAKILHAGADGVKRQPLAATKLYKAAAKRGHASAQNWLGYAYQHGHGVIKDYSTAADWYKNAADQGLADAQNNLALMHLVGHGVPQDHAKAAKLFQLAIEKNHSFAMNNLAGMYEVGWGVSRDPAKAKELYSTAALTGNTSAIENLKRLGEAVPLEAQTRAEQNKNRVNVTMNTASDPSAEAEILSRGDIITDVPSLEASDEEFEEWLSEQDSFDEEIPTADFDGTDPFGFLKKNWNKVDRQRKRRRQSPSESLR